MSPSEEIDELHRGDERVRVRRARWSWTEDGPPLVAEYTAPAGRPVRGTVLLVHGLAQNRFTWRVSRRSLPAALAARGLASLNLELRGHGLSRELGPAHARCWEDYVEDAARVARSVPGPLFAMGHSLGAAVCLALSAEVPLQGVVHLAGVYGFATTNPTLRAMARVSLRLEPVLRGVGPRLSTQWAGELIARLYSLTDFAGYGLPLAGWTPGSIERDVLAERLENGFDWTSLEVWLELCGLAAGRPFPGAATLEQSSTPLLVMSGRDDVLASPEDAAGALVRPAHADTTHIVFDRFEHGHRFGHLDIVIGRHAPDVIWPVALDWMEKRL